MSAAEVLHQLEAAGVRVVMPEPGRLRLVGSDDARAKVKALVLEHKAEIINELTGGPSGLPAHIHDALALGGYEHDLTEWTPAACQRFLNQLKAEWSEFHVNGRYGLTMPDNFPVEFQDAVQSIYVLAIQRPIGSQEGRSRANDRKDSQNPAAGRTERKTGGLK
jgi:hypothetical protein